MTAMLDALGDRVVKGPLVAAAMGAVFGLIGFLDYSTPLGVTVWLLYLLPIWLLSRVTPFDARLVAGGAAAVTALIAATFLLAPADPDFWKSGLNRLIGVALIWIVSLLLIRARRQQMALADSEQQFRVNFEMAAVGQAQLHVGTGRFICVNDRFCDITGYERGELLTMAPRDITHPDDQIAGEAGFVKVMRGDAEEYHHEKR
jgi:PAS domain-containing protein